MGAVRQMRIVVSATIGLGGAVLMMSQVQAQQAGTRKNKAVTAAKEPLKAMGLLLDGFHYHDGSLQDQMEALHHCGEVRSGLFQCALFDPEGRLIGVEYVATADKVKELPAEERALWHSHGYEVTSGMLLAPEMSAGEEKNLMKTLAQTYGKTWHTWHTDKGSEMPVGRPDLMMAFTKKGQAQTDLTARRDRAFVVSTKEIRARRSGIAAPEAIAGVDRGEGGKSCSGASQIRPVKGQDDRP